MSARIFLRQAGQLYSFLRIDQSNDGSMYFAIVRKGEQTAGALKWDHDARAFVADFEDKNGDRKVSYHTSGRVNYHAVVSRPPAFFEPLHNITRRNPLLLVSIPRVTRLDEAIGSNSSDEIAVAVVDIPDAQLDRLTFEVLVAPRSESVEGLNPVIKLDYALFCVIVRTVPFPLCLPGSMSEHFVYAALMGDDAGARAETKAEAEIAYHQRLAGGRRLLVFPANGEGVYTLYPSVVMRSTPRVMITFFKDGYSAQVLADSKPHRIKFKIRGPGGLVKDRDLRAIIQEIELDARM